MENLEPPPDDALHEFRSEVENLFEKVSDMDLVSQMAASHHLEKLLVRLFEQVKTRLQDESKAKTSSKKSTKKGRSRHSSDETSAKEKVKRPARNASKPKRFCEDDITEATIPMPTEAIPMPTTINYEDTIIEDILKTEEFSDDSPLNADQSKILDVDPEAEFITVHFDNGISDEENVEDEGKGERLLEELVEDQLLKEQTLNHVNVEAIKVEGELKPKAKKTKSPKTKLKKEKKEKREKVLKLIPQLKKTEKRFRGRPRKIDYEGGAYESIMVDPNLPSEFPCLVCEKIFRSATSLKVHMRFHVEGHKQCEDCGQLFQTKCGLDTHRRKYHLEDEGLLKCPRCVFTTYSSEAMDYHQSQRHDPKRPRNFVCELCGKGFRLNSILQQHIRCVHCREKRFSCAECDFITHYDGCLRLHMKHRHDPNRAKSECALCGALLGSNSELKLHLQRHAGVKTNKCSVCGKSFVSKSQLSAHVRIHNERSFECTVCLKRFHDKHKLQRHMIVHSESKDFECPDCPYKTNLCDNLRKHCKKQHQKDFPPRRKYRVNDNLLADDKFEFILENANGERIEVEQEVKQYAELKPMSANQDEAAEGLRILYDQTASTRTHIQNFDLNHILLVEGQPEVIVGPEVVVLSVGGQETVVETTPMA